MQPEKEHNTIVPDRGAFGASKDVNQMLGKDTQVKKPRSWWSGGGTRQFMIETDQRETHTIMIAPRPIKQEYTFFRNTIRLFLVDKLQRRQVKRKGSDFRINIQCTFSKETRKVVQRYREENWPKNSNVMQLILGLIDC